jgi:isopenicillin N synthase-like dioxygenase
MADTPHPFTSLPILPLSAALDPATKLQFLQDLRSALLNVGFLYLSETGLPEDLVQDVIKECRGFFERLPLREKERIEMKNEKSFLGWSRVSVIFLFCFGLVYALFKEPG